MTSETEAAVAAREVRSRRFDPFWLVPILALLSLSAWMFASPLGSSPDDDFHLASIWCAEGESTHCEDAATPSERIVTRTLIDGARCFAGYPERSAECAEPLLDSDETIETARGNFSGNYPPVYYATMGMFAGDDIVASALVMRFINILIFVGVTTVLFLLLPARRRPTLLWAWTLTTVPLGLFLIASNNPSSWAITMVGSAWLALLGYFETNGRRKWALGALFLVASVLASGARGDAAIYIVLSAGIAGVMAFRNSRRFWMDAILPLAAALVAIGFYFSSLQSTVVSDGLNDGAFQEVGASPLSILARNIVNVPSLWAGIFGTWQLGWFDTSLPAVVGYAGIAAFVAVVFVGIRMMSVRKGLMLLALGGVLWLLPVYILQQSMDLVGVQVQPRYLLPLIVVFAGLAVLQVGSRILSLTLTQQIVVIIALSAAQAIALYANLRRYIAGGNSGSFNLDRIDSWWWDVPFGPMAVWAVGTIAFTAAITLIVRRIGQPHVTA